MMRTLVSDNGSTRPTIGQLLTVLFYKFLLSKHGKHVFFIASLYGQFNHYANQRDGAIEKFNEAMRLAHRGDAMRLPMAMRGRVWDGTGIDQVLTEHALIEAQDEDQLRSLARKVIEVSMRWTRYAPLNEMTDDVTEYLRNQRDHLPATACA